MHSVHVAVALIKNTENEMLVSLRPEHVHQGGLWEFPGGKVEANETVLSALKREVTEELGLEVLNAQPYKTIRYAYTDKNVLLDIWLVTSFSGDAHGREGQEIKWQPIDKLHELQFPAANRGIVNAMQLPDRYMITGQFNDQQDFLNRLEKSLQCGISLLQLRSKSLSNEQLCNLVKCALPVCHQYQAKLLVNCDLETFNLTEADGLHLSSNHLYSIKQRPFDHTRWLSVSCHTAEDIQQAMQIEADMILLSPVKETTSHPGVAGIGWHVFAEMTQALDIPVYALGGMTETDLPDAKQNGAQGIAAISSFWKATE